LLLRADFNIGEADIVRRIFSSLAATAAASCSSVVLVGACGRGVENGEEELSSGDSVGGDDAACDGVAVVRGSLGWWLFSGGGPGASSRGKRENI